jgi:PAS domain S-box-containing protein
MMKLKLRNWSRSGKQKSDREVSRRALAESNLRFTYAAQATSDAIWDRDYSSDIISWAEGFTTLFGYEVTRETKAVSFWRSKVHPDDLEMISGIIQGAKDNLVARGWSGEYRFLKSNGEYAYVKEKAIILRDEHGIPTRTIGAVQDITEIKKNEIILKEKAIAQGKYEIASDVMHDIGNAVVGFGSYLTRIRRLQNEDSPDNLKNLADFFENKKAEVTSAFGEAKANAIIKMLGSMAVAQKNNQEVISRSIIEQVNIVAHIQEILDIQRQYIAGHESVERKPVNVRNIINDSLAMLFSAMERMSIEVSVNIQADLPLIKGDRTRLMQAVLNLLKNSMEALDGDAKVKTIMISAFSGNGKLVLKVEDNGKGIDQTTIRQLFKRGFTTKSSGSGMGLYSCRTIIESHEGSIDISSEGNGKGTVVTIGFKI